MAEQDNVKSSESVQRETVAGRVDFSLPQGRDFAKTVAMFDYFDLQLEVVPDRIDIMVQNATGGFDTVVSGDIPGLRNCAGSIDPGHGFVFKIVLRGHRDQSLL